jgi:hypothetical protein
MAIGTRIRRKLGVLASCLVLVFGLAATANAARNATSHEAQALVRAAHRSHLIPWQQSGCCTISDLRVSTVNAGWAAGRVCYLVVVDSETGRRACDIEPLLFHKASRAWTLIQVGEPIDCNSAPPGVLHDLKYGCLLPQA